MTRRWLLLAVLLALWTALAYLGLAGLMYLGVDPQTNVATTDPDFRHHGFPIISAKSLLVWLAVLGAYSAGSAALAHHLFLGTRQRAVTLALSLLAATSIYVAACHPTFLAVAVPEAQWAPYRLFVHNHIPFLDEIYGHWGLPRLKYHVMAGQVVLTTMICLLAVAVSRWQARSAPSAQQPSPPAA